MFIRKQLLSCLAVALLTACVSPAPRTLESRVAAGAPVTQTTAPTEIITRVIGASSSSDALSSVLYQQASAEYRSLTLQTFELARQALLVNLGKADVNAAPDAPLKPNTRPAVVVDIDETMLDNSPHQARLIATGLPFDEGRWQAWAAERAAREVPGAVRFAQFVASQKTADGNSLQIFYISNRDAGWKHGDGTPSTIERDTIANLQALGFPQVDDEHVLLRFEQSDWKTKSARRKHLIDQGYRIVLNVGDQLTDFADDFKDTLPAREVKRALTCSNFGRTWILLPNSSYGSFDDALINLDLAQPEEFKRKARAGHLDLVGDPTPELNDTISCPQY